MDSEKSGGVREARKAANKAAILGAGRKVFIETGYEACTIRDIVRESGLSPGTFYNYFESKEAVLGELVQDLADLVRSRVREARAAARDPRSFMEDAYRAYFDVFASDSATLQMVARNQNIFRGVVFGADQGALEIASSGDASGDSNRPVRGIFEDLEADLSLAIRYGLFPEFPVELATYAMVGAGFELLVRMANHDDLDPERAAKFMAGLLIGGLPATGEKS
ncbi:MAG: TetR/AcrR family transcriptional regulator [bacterium]|nr:TetR/AcrR family transcriptional regulator [bacterium]